MSDVIQASDIIPGVELSREEILRFLEYFGTLYTPRGLEKIYAFPKLNGLEKKLELIISDARKKSGGNLDLLYREFGILLKYIIQEINIIKTPDNLEVFKAQILEKMKYGFSKNVAYRQNNIFLVMDINILEYFITPLFENIGRRKAELEKEGLNPAVESQVSDSSDKTKDALSKVPYIYTDGNGIRSLV